MRRRVVTMRAATALLVTLLVAAAAGVVIWAPWEAAPGADGSGVATTVRAVAPPEDTPATLLAAGDIADCDGDAAGTAELLTAHPGVVAPLGDLAYPDGSVEDFAECYAPTWGAVRDRTRPALGNHDVRTADAAGYFRYFGPLAGARPGGYYSYELGDWHVVVLNSNCRAVGGCGADSRQASWLREDLADVDTGNILAYWHHPRFSSGNHGNTPSVEVFWDLLVEAGADVVLAAHSHDYQRFAPLDGDGRPDPRGIRQFVVGTGGASLTGFVQDDDRVEYRQNEHLGVLRLDLEACGYRWAFLPVGGGAPLDEGSATGTC